MGAMEPEIASAPSIGVGRRQTLRHRLGGRLAERLEALFEAERDQLPLWFPVGLGTGIAAWFWLLGMGVWKAFLAASGAAVLAALALGVATRWGRALALFFLAAVAGCALIWWRAHR